MRLTWTNKGLNTLHCELYDSSVFTKGVDGMAGEEARVLPHCGHDLMGADQWEKFKYEVMSAGSEDWYYYYYFQHILQIIIKYNIYL